MEVLTLSSLIGKEVLDIKCHRKWENEHGLQDFAAYIQLAGNIIIDIPLFDDNEFRELSPETVAFLQEKFDTGEPVSNDCRKYFTGQTITDFFFCYDNNNEIDIWWKAYIQLSNRYYISERTFGPPGIAIGLMILDEKEFLDRNKRLGIDVRSFLKTR